MKVFESVKELRAELDKAEQSGIGFVPTMGALHAGHRSLVERARRENGTVVVSVFVNPTQFNDKNDLKHYPRTPEADARLLEEAGADFVLMPTVEEERVGFQPLISSIVLHILGSVLFKHSNLLYSDNPVVEKINRAKAIMRTDFGRNRSPEQIAREVGMGYTWFRRVFREYVGMAPAQYQHTMRLNKARELLATTAHSISEIAYALGFESVSAFSLFFRLRERLSPSQYRARFRGGKGQ